jgi:hypothetical protein
MQNTKRRNRGESPEDELKKSLPGHSGLPFAQDAADVQPGPNVQTNRQAAPNGQPDSLATFGSEASQPEADPFDVASLRLPQDFASAVGVKKLITTIRVQKPSKEWFVRTHPDPAYRLQTAVLELKDGDREVYLVAPDLWPELATEPTFSPRLLVFSITRQSIPFVWPIRLPGADGKIDDWSRSAMDAADHAKTRWVRVKSNMALGAYEIEVASGRLSEPSWPDITFQAIIKIAFRDKMISTLDHPVLQKLRGEV